MCVGGRRERRKREREEEGGAREGTRRAKKTKRIKRREGKREQVAKTARLYRSEAGRREGKSMGWRGLE